MLFTGTIGLAFALASLSAFAQGQYSGPTSVEEYRKLHPYVYPYAVYRPETYIRPSKNETDDVSAEFYWGLKNANNGGRLVLPKNQTFVIGKKLDLTFLKDVEVNLEGKILFTNDIAYWQANNFYHPFQESISFWKWGGEDIKIYGSGTLDGNGQQWWDAYAGQQLVDKFSTYLRPILFYAENTTNLHVEGIRFQGSPCWTNFIVTSKDVVYDKVVIENVSANKNRPKNSDGLDSYNVDGLTVRDSWFNTGDDCYSAKPNSSNIHVENMYCNGTHGMSMGSIGQYAGVKDYIVNAHFENVAMLNGKNGARLKIRAGKDVGYGFIDNITFNNFQIEKTDWPIVLDACYLDLNATECAKYPSQVDVTNIHFSNFRGRTSGRKGRKVAFLVCSPGAVCTNITLDNIELTSPKGSPTEILCNGITGGVGMPCIPTNGTTDD